MTSPSFSYPGATYSLNDPLVVLMILAWGLSGFFIVASAVMLRRWYCIPRIIQWPVMFYGMVLTEAALEVYFHKTLSVPTGFRVSSLFFTTLLVMVSIIRLTWGKVFKHVTTDRT